MSRRVWIGATVVSAALLLLLSRPSTSAPAPKKAPPVVEAINKPRTFGAVDDKTVTLDQFLDSLRTVNDIDIDVDEEAFAEDGLPDVRNFLVGEKPIPKMKDVTTAYYLRKILKRVPSTTGATFWVRQNRLEVTTFKAVRDKVWGQDYAGPYYPLVNAAYDKKPLAEIAQELADENEVNVVVDVRAADQAKTQLTAKFANAPLDTVLKLLADQADLQTVAVDNVIVVTTAERAAILKARRDKERKQEEQDGGTPARRLAPGSGGHVPSAPMGM